MAGADIHMSIAPGRRYYWRVVEAVIASARLGRWIDPAAAGEGVGSMKTARSIRAATAALMSLLLVAVVGVRPAQAVDPVTVVKVIQQIYSVYKQFTAGGGGL